MNVFIIGDVHGCYYTFKAILEFWNPNTEILIQVGDLIDRGNYTPQVIKLCKELQQKYSEVHFLKGNHESMAIQYFRKEKEQTWYPKYGKSVLWQYVLSELNFEEDAKWISTLKTYWENEHIFVSHAGMSDSIYAMDENHYSGLLWQRLGIKNIGKVQVYGHTPLRAKLIVHDIKSNSYNIDSGAYLGNALSALRLNNKGEHLESIRIPTIEKDII